MRLTSPEPSNRQAVSKVTGVSAPTPLRTERLTLDPWTEADGRLLGDLARTPAVMRYVGDGTTWSDARIHGVGQQVLAHWAEHGFGWRVARADGAPVGFIALNFAGEGAGIDAHEYEIGWWLAPSVWGRGLAREGAAAVRDEAFDRVGAPSIVARIRPENARIARRRRGDRFGLRARRDRPWRRDVLAAATQPGPRLASSSSASFTSLTRGRPIDSPSDDS